MKSGGGSLGPDLMLSAGRINLSQVKYGKTGVPR